jgi:hypothetical protein
VPVGHRQCERCSCLLLVVLCAFPMPGRWPARGVSSRVGVSVLVGPAPPMALVAAFPPGSQWACPSVHGCLLL